MDKTLVIIIAVIILVGAGFWAWQSGIFSKVPVQPAPLPSGIVEFYGQGCPHCKDVDDFVAQNKITDKVKFTKMEVWYNPSNQLTLGLVAQKCGINLNQVGVPLLYDGAKCYEGEVGVINFFKNAAGIK